MKRTVYGPEKCDAWIQTIFFHLPLMDSPKGRKYNYVRARMRESRPSGGYPRYWDQRNRPYQMYNNEPLYGYGNVPYYWKERYGE
ncbi:hypothetical protein ABTQ33_07610 [Paucilactobacillus suebicus]|uniref:hypothetical protein n=1 Tax=Paucilactobacillus suebicus TaxID=152335 RepID=UPI0002490577|nr:hypothetical protein [Paucilactobacillus suebicus]